ncbi:unnamed protein product [Cyprideis torosa]|uniref:Uncharacterized protein n=1 Tax=Cyprideis torosa TaxID=163714 RepID=A0A7R8ZM37_9CRUS|nr:unnamed protein product [Cyprideis torosa]CAG0883475.1 unnamed protein product [Cyprideis torosa]
MTSQPLLQHSRNLKQRNQSIKKEKVQRPEKVWRKQSPVPPVSQANANGAEDTVDAVKAQDLVDGSFDQFVLESLDWIVAVVLESLDWIVAVVLKSLDWIAAVVLKSLDWIAAVVLIPGAFEELPSPWSKGVGRR